MAEDEVQGEESDSRSVVFFGEESGVNVFQIAMCNDNDNKTRLGIENLVEHNIISQDEEEFCIASRGCNSKAAVANVPHYSMVTFSPVSEHSIGDEYNSSHNTFSPVSEAKSDTIGDEYNSSHNSDSAESLGANAYFAQDAADIVDDSSQESYHGDESSHSGSDKPRYPSGGNHEIVYSNENNEIITNPHDDDDDNVDWVQPGAPSSSGVMHELMPQFIPVNHEQVHRASAPSRYDEYDHKERHELGDFSHVQSAPYYTRHSLPLYVAGGDYLADNEDDLDIVLEDDLSVLEEPGRQRAKSHNAYEKRNRHNKALLMTPKGFIKYSSEGGRGGPGYIEFQEEQLKRNHRQRFASPISRGDSDGEYGEGYILADDHPIEHRQQGENDWNNNYNVNVEEPKNYNSNWNYKKIINKIVQENNYAE